MSPLEVAEQFLFLNTLLLAEDPTPPPTPTPAIHVVPIPVKAAVNPRVCQLLFRFGTGPEGVHAALSPVFT